jgi:diacylglycerol kinase family enzyme
VDGEYLGPLPVRFTVTDDLLRIVVPVEFPSPLLDNGMYDI